MRSNHFLDLKRHVAFDIEFLARPQCGDVLEQEHDLSPTVNMGVPQCLLL